jgi:hypothetical protein
MSDSPNGDWREHRLLILAELKRISDSISALENRLDEFRSEEIQKIKVDIAMLQVKASLWGGVWGAGLSAIVALVVKFIK